MRICPALIVDVQGDEVALQPRYSELLCGGTFGGAHLRAVDVSQADTDDAVNVDGVAVYDAGDRAGGFVRLGYDRHTSMSSERTDDIIFDFN